MRKVLLLLLVLTFSFTIGFNQSDARKPIDLVNDAKKISATFQDVNLFKLDTQTKREDVGIEEDIQEYNLFDVNQDLLKTLGKNQPGTISLRIPTNFTGSFELELVKVDIFSPDFSVIRRSDNAVVDVNTGVHYRGIIKGDATSIAAISIFEDEVMGLISWDERNIVLGRLQNESAKSKHIAYDDLPVFQRREFYCGTRNDGIGYKRKDLEFKYETDTRAVGDCIRLYIEVDKDIHDDKGGVAGATNYVTGLLNQVTTLYGNESLLAVVSQIVVWDVTSPYSSNSSSGMLSDFQNNISSINGELGQLLSYQASGGIAAGFSGICNSNVDNSLSFSSIQSSYANVPTYSWSVMVVTHEFGHTWGSRHTHACVWNGNNTAIDGCSGSTEGSCSLPGTPPQGGTIMSYCHLQSVGINFNEGFGPQPGNVIRNSVANASCTTSCGPPTCTDGVQNGNETGVDCGGPDCPACPTCNDGIQNGDETGVDCGGSNCAPCPCFDNGVTLTILLDNYPEETSWDIRSGSTVVASGGTYGSQPDGSTVVEVACLPDGCYDFTIYDSYGDGICCSYGVGNYSLTDDASGSVLASGGSFGSSEVTNFCVGGGPAPTCTDGIQNGQETGVDCGGPDCPPCPCDVPDGLAASPTNVNASLSWSVANGAIDYNVRARATGTSTWTTGNNLTSPVNYTGLTACTQYEFQVQSNCTGQTSAWSASFVFTTTGCTNPTCDDGIQNGQETGVDCGGPDCPPCPTCDDGIQNGEETGVDCGGPDCPACPGGGCTYEVIDFNDFNSSWGIWNDGGSDCRRSANDAQYAFGGTGRPVRLRDNTSTSVMTTDNLNLTGYEELTVDFTYYPRSMDNSNEDFWLQISTNGGSSYTTVEEWNRGDEFENNIRYFDAVVISGPFTSNTRLRFRCDASANGDYVYIDNVEISGCLSGSALVRSETQEVKTAKESLVMPEQLRLFPNPVNDELAVNFEIPNRSDVVMIVTDLQGRKMEQKQFDDAKGRIDTTIDVRTYPAGIYVVHLMTPSGRLTEKFVVSK